MFWLIATILRVVCAISDISTNLMAYIKWVIISQVRRHTAPNGTYNQKDLFFLRCDMLMDRKRSRHAPGVCK
jgi:hypothetical protein